jgi:hypothetical protein
MRPLQRSELPAEADRRPLSFAELAEVLGALAGDRVIVRADASADTGSASGPPGISFVGRLAVDASAREGVAELLIGDPLGTAGGRVRIPASALREATLSTFDGNDFVIVHVRLPGLSIQLQDENSGAL